MITGNNSLYYFATLSVLKVYPTGGIVKLLYFKFSVKSFSLHEFASVWIGNEVYLFNFTFTFLRIDFLSLILLYNYVKYLYGSKVKSTK